MPVNSVASFAVRSFVERQASRIAVHIAEQAVRHMEYAKLTGALPDEVGFDFDVAVSTYLR